MEDGMCMQRELIRMKFDSKRSFECRMEFATKQFISIYYVLILIGFSFILSNVFCFVFVFFSQIHRGKRNSWARVIIRCWMHWSSSQFNRISSTIRYAHLNWSSLSAFSYVHIRWEYNNWTVWIYFGRIWFVLLYGTIFFPSHAHVHTHATTEHGGHHGHSHGGIAHSNNKLVQLANTDDNENNSFMYSTEVCSIYL